MLTQTSDARAMEKLLSLNFITWRSIADDASKQTLNRSSIPSLQLTEHPSNESQAVVQINLKEIFSWSFRQIKMFSI